MVSRVLLVYSILVTYFNKMEIKFNNIVIKCSVGHFIKGIEEFIVGADPEFFMKGP